MVENVRFVQLLGSRADQVDDFTWAITKRSSNKSSLFGLQFPLEQMKAQFEELLNGEEKSEEEAVEAIVGRNKNKTAEKRIAKKKSTNLTKKKGDDSDKNPK